MSDKKRILLIDNEEGLCRMMEAVLKDNGFEVETVLSGSNLRSPRLKKVLGKNVLLGLEKVMQPLLAPVYFGPSIWLLLKKQ